MSVVEVVEIARTCRMFPAQWEGRCADGRWFYARFRHGWFYAAVAPTLDEAVDADDDTTEGRPTRAVLLASATFGEDEDPEMSDARMRELVAGGATWAC